MKFRNLFKVMLAAMLICSVSTTAEAVTKKSASRSKSKTTATRKSSSTSIPKVIAGDVHTYGDQLTTQNYSVKKGESEINIEFPIAGNPAIVDALKKYIASNVYMADNRGQKITYSFAANETPEIFLRKAIAPYRTKGSLDMNGETITQKISVIYNNGDVVTLKDSGYIYSGGAHGMPWEEGASFLKSDGTCLEYSMLPGIGVMRPYIEAGLAEYIEVPVNELYDYYQCDRVEYPGGEGTTPYVDADGLNIQYGVYEISDYSMGAPKAVIPKSKARQVCSGKALKFLE